MGKYTFYRSAIALGGAILVAASPARAQLENKKRQTSAQDADRQRAAAAAAAQAAAAQAAADKAAADKAVSDKAAADLQETLRWLEVYFRSTNEQWAGYEGKTLSTTAVENGVTVKYEYDICSLRDIRPEFGISGKWDGTTPTLWLRVNFPHGIYKKDGAPKSGLFGFAFPQPALNPSTEPAPGQPGRVLVGVTEQERVKRTLSADPGHPAHRFSRALSRLVELECGPAQKSPFE